MSKKRAIEIVRMLSRTIRTMKDENQWEGNCTVIKSPRAKKKDLIKKKKELQKKYNL
jgi:hypothetical protein